MEKERLRFCIERFDHYYDSVNSKGSVFLALSTFVVGGLITIYPTIIEKISEKLLGNILISGLIGIGISIILILVNAAIPYLVNQKASIHYFGFISNLAEDDFGQRSKELNSEIELEDLRSQVYQLSKGLSKKFKNLRIAGILFIIQFSLFIPLIFLMITNF